MSTISLRRIEGGCHCAAVRFAVELEGAVEVHECNCSICRMTGFQHLIVPRARFQLQQGEQDLSCYRFNTGVAQHLFCQHCGIKSFYVPRSNPDGVSVNLRCLDERPEQCEIRSFDGQHWEQNAGRLQHLSHDEST